MGGSRRKLKRNAPKVRVGVVKRSKKQKSSTPTALASNVSEISKKMGASLGWKDAQTLSSNYAANRLASSPNRALHAVVGDECGFRDAACGDSGSDKEDDDMRSVLGKKLRETHKQPSPLTAKQRQIIERLTDRHQDDIAAMVRDTKLNKMLLPASKLSRMLEAFYLYPEGARVCFQQPKKRLL